MCNAERNSFVCYFLVGYISNLIEFLYYALPDDFSSQYKLTQLKFDSATTQIQRTENLHQMFMIDPQKNKQKKRKGDKRIDWYVEYWKKKAKHMMNKIPIKNFSAIKDFGCLLTPFNYVRYCFTAIRVTK